MDILFSLFIHPIQTVEAHPWLAIPILLVVAWLTGRSSPDSRGPRRLSTRELERQYRFERWASCTNFAKGTPPNTTYGRCSQCGTKHALDIWSL
jgi:hypothetical protein